MRDGCRSVVFRCKPEGLRTRLSASRLGPGVSLLRVTCHGALPTSDVARLASSPGFAVYRYQADFAEFNAVTPAAMYGMGIGYTYPRVVTQPLGAPAGPPGRGSDPDQADGVFEWPETGAGMVRARASSVNAGIVRHAPLTLERCVARRSNKTTWRTCM